MKCSHCGGEAPMSASATRWRREEDGTIRFSVTSDGTTGEDWIKRSEGKGDHVSDCAKCVLCSENFVPTSGVTYEVAMLPGSLWSSDDVRTTKIIHAKARKRGFGKLNAEVACLIRDAFTDEELAAMGFWLVIVMHKPISTGGDMCRLGVGHSGGGRRLIACRAAPLYGWARHNAFAFAATQVSD